MRRWARPGAVSLLALIPLALLWLFGVARVAAPFGLLGLLFDHPWDYALVAGAAAAASVVLMAIRPVDRRVGRLMTGGREPDQDERERLERLLDAVGAQAGIDAGGFHLLVQDDDSLNAAAGGGHVILVTRGALTLPDDQLAAILAHEVGHHRDLLPVMTALMWWSRLPALPIRWAARALRAVIARTVARLRSPFGWLAIPLELVVILVQLSLLWLVYLADIAAAWVSRIAEFAADRRAADWGFAVPLATALGAIAGDHGPHSRLDRLFEDYPPTSERVQRLRGWNSDPPSIPAAQIGSNNNAVTTGRDSGAGWS